ncbi:MAG TPA: phosphatase PAP2 family protein [Ferruginibacter sp.]|nr:phosphatase PAP2 family protein [Ferruginibacter sp.]
MQQLLYYDRYFFTLINWKWQNNLFDTILPILRSSICWLPLYLFLLVFALCNFKRNIFWWVCFAAGTAILTDFISSELIKENFFRTRPFNDPFLIGKSRMLLGYSPSSSSFTSSHATNHFGLATFFYFTLSPYFGKWSLVFFLWAIIICYAQVYVGVHYPLDVIVGGVIGCIFGYLTSRSFNKQFSLA